MFLLEQIFESRVYLDSI